MSDQEAIENPPYLCHIGIYYLVFLMKKERMFNRLLKIDANISSGAFVFGPIGTGKTTWLKTYFADTLYFDLLDATVYSEFLANPTRLNNYIPQAFTNWIIIDEIQRVPELLNEIHRLIESRKLRFILTGSSATSLRRKVPIYWLVGH